MQTPDMFYIQTPPKRKTKQKLQNFLDCLHNNIEDTTLSGTSVYFHLTSLHNHHVDITDGRKL
jgi:hypothetical protein